LAGVNDVEDRADDPDRASPIPLLPILRTVLSCGVRATAAPSDEPVIGGIGATG
jgi:hypothetical protein